MYRDNKKIKPFSEKIWLSTPTMHGEEMQFVKEAYDTNWMSTVGANINEVERIAAEVGFADAKSFCRVFKAQMGISPGAYRKQFEIQKQFD